MLRAYRPAGQGVRGCIYHIHGGGYVAGKTDMAWGPSADACRFSTSPWFHAPFAGLPAPLSRKPGVSHLMR